MSSNRQYPITPRVRATLSKKHEKATETFSDIIQQDLICPICLDIITEPYIIYCKNACVQNACKKCVLRMDNLKCFSCKQEAISLPAGAAMNNVCSKVERTCNGCNTKFITCKSKAALEQKTEHTKTCSQVLVKCIHKKHGCEKIITRSNLTKHILEECKFVPCKHNFGIIDNRLFGCEFKGTYEETKQHETSCFTTAEGEKIMKDLEHMCILNNSHKKKDAKHSYVTPEVMKILSDLFSD